MLYNQPLAHRFGTALTNDIESGKWNRIEMAVAWARRSGTQHLEEPFKKFLGRGGFAQITVGVDIENTSAEGLKDLLALEFETHIHHNEADSTFHPKVYLLETDVAARLIVGSNNLTGAGLFVNTEAGLQLDALLSDPLIRDARAALAAWRDTNTGLAKKLDETLLNDLIKLGYVFPEQELRKRRKTSDEKAVARRPAAAQALFKAQRYSMPPVRKAPQAIRDIPGTVLLMRVRKARGTQVQMPFQLVKTDFFKGIGEIVSEHDARAHGLHPAKAHGKQNTIKVEIPETATMMNPVLRLERTANAITYRAFDAGSIMGSQIRDALLMGFKLKPQVTFSTISNRERATWWRFI
jgi:HKD family nuclease